MEFFDDLSVPVKFLLAFVVALAVLGVGGYLMRRFSGGNLAALSPRGRQPRLAVINAARVDGSRRLVLVRRDNVEHLLLIGGPTDVVIEPNIDRTGAAATTPAPVRDAKAGPPPEPPPRQTLSLEGSGLPPGEPVYVEPPPPSPVREMTREAMLHPPPVPIERQRVESLIEDNGAPPPAANPAAPRWTDVLPPTGTAFLRTGGSCPAGAVALRAGVPDSSGAGTETHAGAAAAAAGGPGRGIQSRRNGAAAASRARRPIKQVEPVPWAPPPGSRFASAPASLPTPPDDPTPLRELATPPATAREPTPDLKVAAIEPAPLPGPIEEEMASLLGRLTGKM